MPREKLSVRVEAERGRPFDEVLDEYRTAAPEEIALDFGCSVAALMREASGFGFKIVNVRRIERKNRAAA